MFKSLQQRYKAGVQKKLEQAVVAYFEAHPEVKLVVVTGSVGKTSTKTAIATMLAQGYRVRLHEGNHNTPMSVPLAILGVPYPDNVHSFTAWSDAVKAARARILAPTDVDVIVQELGADHPGDITAFGRYLKPYISVVTAVTPEHMEFFKTIDAVAREELAAANFGQLALINRDDIDGKYAEFISNANLSTYGTSAAAEYHFDQQDFSVEKGHSGTLVAPGLPSGIAAIVNVLGDHNLRPAIAAAAVGMKFNMQPDVIKSGLEKIRPIPGRMNMLRGLNGSMIIDDSYNSSPAAAVSAIQTFYSIDAPQRIAIMGSMNELGDSSPAEHKMIGEMFHPDVVEWVITIGDDAEKYLAPAAHSQGCQIKSFKNAVQAGAFAHSVMAKGALVLVKGSQGNVYAEEAVKILLLDQNDADKLVRQSPAWVAHKEEFFERNLV
ncbi:MAG: UDP-N-acetylmuramoyl-tripeptide--D-alanyl-D-alanine ligase [Candidatus Nomurabacteria bacterium]|nr:MAG: UDP-N-acetylmuramoyl-tripeptide--D-alanyl-D-alanine ligase [Candidatus Nomurabacteria bacterium]